MNILDKIDLSNINLEVAVRMANAPWAMEGRAFSELTAWMLHQALGGNLQLGAETEPKIRDDGTATGVQRDDYLRVAVMPIRGCISPYYMGFGELRTNPYAILHDARRLRDDRNIETIILDIDSPGGTSAGLQMAVEALEELSAAGKRVIAWNRDTMASAAYWIGASADEVYAHPEAETGSIGVYIAFPDYSRLMSEKLGIDINVFRDGTLKGMGVMGKSLTSDEADYLQARVDELSEKFKGYIRSRRVDVSDQTMQGQTFNSRDALAYGLIDGIMTDLSELIAAAAGEEPLRHE